MDLRAIEFFSGIGGWRYAMNGLNGLGRVVSAYDISEIANSVYKLNFGDSPTVRELATIPVGEIRALAANAWLMSPPCQPFCRMGKSLGLNDARAAAFIHLMGLLIEARPQRFVLENVEGFLESEGFELLAQRLNDISLRWRCISACPTRFGIPNRRPRVYVAASAHGVRNDVLPLIEPSPLFNYLDTDEDESLYLSPETTARHGPGLDLATPESRSSACFIGGYGKRFVGGGSFLKTNKGVRRFSPGEVSRLLGYPPGFRFPDGIPLNKQYKLLGNGLNIAVAEWVLGQLD